VGVGVGARRERQPRRRATAERSDADPGGLLELDDAELVGTDRNGLSRAEYAGLFAAALALRAEQPTLAAYGFEAELVDVPKGGSVLPLARQFNRSLGGTRTFDVLAQLYWGHDRVVILTDEQAFAPGSDAWRRQYGGDGHGLRSARGLDLHGWGPPSTTTSAVAEHQIPRLVLGAHREAGGHDEDAVSLGAAWSPEPRQPAVCRSQPSANAPSHSDWSVRPERSADRVGPRSPRASRW
jgi:hypothetical protein